MATKNDKAQRYTETYRGICRFRERERERETLSSSALNSNHEIIVITCVFSFKKEVRKVMWHGLQNVIL